MKEFSLVNEEDFKNIKREAPEVIEISKLGEFVNSNNKSKAFEYLNYLIQVANQEYISEYLLELATLKSPFQFLFCWHIFKTIRHTENENQFSLLKLGISCLMDRKQNRKTYQFELICYHNQILNTPMIRANSIAPFLNDLVNKTKVDIS
ncbi:MAG: hypothetical protein H8E72_04635, partial [Candidatus Marinimicrobia bacterium]|nr:hypothetical protein [Candidatus Neomarinimicrobiota bacterium]